MVFSLEACTCFVTYSLAAPLAKHLEEQEAQYVQFAFRWMNCLLMRELPLPLIIRMWSTLLDLPWSGMWDTYLAEGDSGFSVFHVYVCASYICRWSAELKKLPFQVMCKPPPPC